MSWWNETNGSFGSFDVLSKKNKKWLYKRTLHQRIKLSDWELEVRNRACGCGEILGWTSTSIKIISRFPNFWIWQIHGKEHCKLEQFFDWLFLQLLKVFEWALAGWNHSLVTETYSFKNRDMSKLTQPFDFCNHPNFGWKNKLNSL